MVKNGETRSFGGLPLLSFYGGAFELDHLTAIDADHMVVVGVSYRMLVAHAPPLEGAFLDKPGIHHQIERPVHCDPADTDSGFAREISQVIDREMAVRGED